MPNVYYAICPGTGGTSDKKTGSPTISISSGVATLSVAQTGNIGQGFRITYDTSSVCYISRVNSSTSFNVVTATGGTPANCSGKTVNSIAADYASLSAAEAGASDSAHLNTSDLVTATTILNLVCYAGASADTSSAIIDGWTTSANYYVHAYVANGGTQSLSKNRHAGIWDSTKYYLSVASGTADLCLSDNYCRLTGFQTTGAIWGIFTTSGADYITISDCIVTHSSGTPDYGIRIHGSGLNRADVRNCIVYGSFGRSISRYYDGSGLVLYVTNCTVVGGRTAGIADRQGSSLVAVNCAVINTADDFAGTGITVSYCASDDADGTNAVDLGDSADSWNAQFLDYAKGDVRLKSGSSLINAGTTVSGMEAVDIIGTSRPQGVAWDIGAFEYVARTTIDVGAMSLLFGGKTINAKRSIVPSIFLLACNGKAVNIKRSITPSKMGLVYGQPGQIYILRNLKPSHLQLSLSGKGAKTDRNIKPSNMSLSASGKTVDIDRSLLPSHFSAVLAGGDVTVFGETAVEIVPGVMTLVLSGRIVDLDRNITPAPVNLLLSGNGVGAGLVLAINKATMLFGGKESKVSLDITPEAANVMLSGLGVAISTLELLRAAIGLLGSRIRRVLGG